MVLRRPWILRLLNFIEPAVTLVEFIRENMSDSWEVLEHDVDGEWWLRRVNTRLGEGSEVRLERTLEVELLLPGLPTDNLTEAEQELRSALMHFLDEWKGETPPCLHEAERPGTPLRNDIVFAKLMCLPFNGSLITWIQNRIGG